MSSEEPSVRRKIVAAAIFAVLASFLLWNIFFSNHMFGINIPITAVLYYAAVFCTAKCTLRYKHNWILLLFIAAFCASFALFSNTALLCLNGIAAVVLTAVQTALMTKLTERDGRPLFISAAENACELLLKRPYDRITEVYKSVFAKDDGNKRTAVSVVIALAVSVPILILLIVLLTSGDMVFNKYFNEIFNLEDAVDFLKWVWLFGWFFTLAGSFFAGLGAAKDNSEKKWEQRSIQIKGISLILNTVLSAVSIPMLAFSVIQIIYLFGNRSLPEGMIYSEYARRGFFELAGAAALIFIVIASAVYFGKNLEEKKSLISKLLLTVLVFSLMILIISSFRRMVLYEQIYLFTRLRLYVQAFLIMLGIITLFVFVKIWKRDFKIFICVFYIVISSLLALTYFNADGFIGRNNAVLLNRENALEDPESYFRNLEYMLTLSADALPEYAEYIYEDFSAEGYMVFTDCGDRILYFCNAASLSAHDFRSRNMNKTKVLNILKSKEIVRIIFAEKMKNPAIRR